MKFPFYLFLFSLFVSHSLSAQDTIIKRNGDSLKPQVYIKLADNSIYYYGKQFKYHNNIIGDTALQTILINTKDSAIIHLVHISKHAQNLQYIGVLAIPFLAAAIYSYNKIPVKHIPAYSAGSVPGSGVATYTKDKRYVASFTTFISLTVVCPVTSFIFKQRRINYTHKSIELYNQKY